MVDLVQKTFRDFTTDIDESHSLSSRASLAYDLLLAATSREIARKTCVHTWGLSPSFLAYLGTVPGFSWTFRAANHRSQGRDLGRMFIWTSTNSRDIDHF